MGKQDPPAFFGDWLKRQRQTLDLTQEDLAQRSGCSVFAIRKIESGERRPSKQLASLIATALKIPDENHRTFIRVARGELRLERLRTSSLTPDSQSIQKPESPAPPVYLPLSTTPLLGREAELDAMGRIFSDPHCRLLTLTGPGGIGKTRLAIEFASRQSTSFPGGVYYVPLAPLESPNLIVPAIADALGLTFSGSVDPKDQLLSYFERQVKQPALLVLDNMEHLLNHPSQEHEMGEAADLIVEILGRLPKVRILTTSRERLNLHGEWTFELHGLSVPPVDFTGDLKEYSAAALFIESARRIRANFELTVEERAAVVRIVQFVEGIPLAIEMATGWVEMLSCEEIAHEIESNLDMLATSMRDIPPRHRSIRATFDHSWKLLSDEERLVMRRLSVFQGGFDRAAAEAVAGATLLISASLVSKSLVRWTDSGRYDLHEVIRQYASSHLLGDPEEIETRDRHSIYYLAMVGDREKALKSAAQGEALRELIEEMDNVRAAWAWAIEREMLEPIGGAVRSLGWLFEFTGLLRRGIKQFELLIQKIKGRANKTGWEMPWGVALAQQSLLFFRKGEFAQARTLLEESLAILRPLGDRTILTDPLVYLGIIQHLNGDLERSRLLMEEGLACAQAGGDQWFAAYAIYNLGYIASLKGQYEDGYERMTDGIKIWQTLGDPHSISLGYNFLSPTLINLERFEQAQTFLQESLKLCEKTGDRWGRGTAYRYLGLTHMVLGDLSEAQSLIRKSLDIFSGYIIGWDIAISLILLGEATMRAGDLQSAEQTFLDALRTAQDAKSVPLTLDGLLGLANIRARRGEYELAAQLAYFVQNHSKSVQETKERAGKLLSEMEKHLTASQGQAAVKKAANNSLESLVAAFDSV